MEALLVLFFLGGEGGGLAITIIPIWFHPHIHIHIHTQEHAYIKAAECSLVDFAGWIRSTIEAKKFCFLNRYCYNMAWEGGAQQWREVHSVFWSQGAARSPVRVWGLAPEAFINVAVCDQALGFTSRTITTRNVYVSA